MYTNTNKLNRKLQIENVTSSKVLDVLYDFFDTKDDKLKWKGSLEDLKAFILTEIDEETADSTSWRSPGGGKWCFESKELAVTWQKKSMNIQFGGERGKEVLYNNYSKTRNMIGQYPCRMRQSCTGNLKVDFASHFTSLLRASNCRQKNHFNF